MIENRWRRRRPRRTAREPYRVIPRECFALKSDRKTPSLLRRAWHVDDGCTFARAASGFSRRYSGAPSRMV